MGTLFRPTRIRRIKAAVIAALALLVTGTVSGVRAFAPVPAFAAPPAAPSSTITPLNAQLTAARADAMPATELASGTPNPGYTDGPWYDPAPQPPVTAPAPSTGATLSGIIPPTGFLQDQCRDVGTVVGWLCAVNPAVSGYNTVQYYLIVNPLTYAPYPQALVYRSAVSVTTQFCARLHGTVGRNLPFCILRGGQMLLISPQPVTSGETTVLVAPSITPGGVLNSECFDLNGGWMQADGRAVCVVVDSTNHTVTVFTQLSDGTNTGAVTTYQCINVLHRQVASWAPGRCLTQNEGGYYSLPLTTEPTDNGGLGRGAVPTDPYDYRDFTSGS